MLAGDDFVEESIDVPRSKHGRIIGKGGIKMKQVQSESGAHVNIPKQEAQSDRIVLKGRKEAVEKAKQLIQELVGDEEEGGVMSTKLHVPKDKHRLIIGKGGATVNEIREKANVDIVIPPANSREENIIIRGENPDGIESAIKEIQRITGQSFGGGYGGGRGGGREGERRGSNGNYYNNNNNNEGGNRGGRGGGRGGARSNA